MRKPLVASIAITLGVALAALMGTGVASTSALGSGAHQQAQAAAAHQAFVKYMSSHATMMRATGRAATLERAKTDFKDNWEKWLAWAKLAETQGVMMPFTS